MTTHMPGHRSVGMGSRWPCLWRDGAFDGGRDNRVRSRCCDLLVIKEVIDRDAQFPGDGFHDGDVRFALREFEASDRACGCPDLAGEVFAR